jgi:hypothetical protein
MKLVAERQNVIAKGVLATFR